MLDGWTIEKDPATNPRYSEWLPEFKYAVRNPVLYANLAAGPEVSPEALRFQDVEGDRAVYEFLLDYAPRHLGAVGAKPRGVHLLFHNGRGQIGLTYFSDTYWTRKVSIIVKNELAKPFEIDGETVPAAGEFVFTFGLFGGMQHWKDYCLMTPLMDDLAVSLAWE